jgi:single-strand DNA-binding protein
MATTITGKLNKPANTFQAGESTGFGVRLGVKYRDPKTKEDAWCNYSAVIFAKSSGQIQFYQSALVEGAVIEVTAEQLKIDSFQGKDSVMLSIEMLNARLGYIHTPQGAQQSAPQQQGGFQGQQQAPQNQGGFNNQQQQPQQHGGYNQQAAAQAQRDENGFTAAQGGFGQNQQQSNNPNDPPF